MTEQQAANPFMMRTVSTFPAVIGAVIRAAREFGKWSSEDISELMQTSQATWSKVERGLTDLSLAQLGTVAVTFGLRTSSILMMADAIVDQIKAGGAHVYGGVRRTFPAGENVIDLRGVSGLIASQLAETESFIMSPNPVEPKRPGRPKKAAEASSEEEAPAAASEPASSSPKGKGKAKTKVA